MLGSSAMAAAITWNDDGADDAWATGDNWTGTPDNTAPTDDLTSDVATFGAKGALGNPNLEADRSVSGINLTDAAGGWDLTGDAAITLTLGAGGIDTAGDNTVSIETVALGADSTWTVADTKTLILDSKLTGSFSVTLDSTGEVELGADNSGWDGGLAFGAAGSVEVGNANGLGTGGISMTADGGELDLNSAGSSYANTFAVSNAFTITATDSATLSGDISGSGDLTLAPAGTKTLTLSGQLTGSNDISLSGLGTVVLSNDNSAWEGDLSFGAAGTVRVTDADALGDAAITTSAANGELVLNAADATFDNNIAASEALQVTLSANATLSGKISGAGFLTLDTGGNTLTLSGVNTHTGGIDIDNGGTVAIESHSAFGATSNTVDLSAATEFTASSTKTVAQNIDLNEYDLTISANNLTLSGDIADTGDGGALIFSGTGTLTLSGDNTEVDGTTISNGGTVVFAQNSSLGGASFAVVLSADGATLSAGGNNARTIANDITATALGAGEGWTIDGENLTVDGAVALNAGAAATTLTINNTQTTFAGGMTGNGAVTLDGTGKLIIATTGSTHSGAFNVNSGELSLQTSKTDGTITVASGAILSGAGTLTSGGVTIQGGGHFRPGNSVGTFTMGGGNLQLAANSTLQVEIDKGGASDNDVVDVTGDATLTDGANIAVVVLGTSDTVATDDTFDVITTSGSLTATPANLNITDNSALLDFTASVEGGTDLRLTAARGEYQDALTNPTTNQLALTSSLTSLRSNYGSLTAALQADLNALDALSVAQFNSATQALSGESVAAAIGSGVSASSQAFNGGMTGRAANIRTANAMKRHAEQGPSAVAGPYNRYRTDNMDNGWGFWVDGIGTWGEQDSISGAEGYDYNTSGTAFGLDHQLNDKWLIGISAGFSNTEVDSETGSTETDIDTTNIGLYVTYEVPKWYVDAGFSYGMSDVDISRRITGIGTNTGNTESDAYSLYAIGGYHFGERPWIFTPIVGLSWTRVETDGYNEAGAMPQSIGEFESDTFNSHLGARLEYFFDEGLVGELRATWMHDFVDDDQTVAGRFIGAPAGTGSFESKGLNPGDDSGILGCGMKWNMSETITLHLDYDVELREEFLAHNLVGGVRIEF
jgi:outer membrane autotransporter protein